MMVTDTGSLLKGPSDTLYVKTAYQDLQDPEHT